MLKRTISIQNDKNKCGNCFPCCEPKKQLSLSHNKFVCTVIWTVEFYSWTILLTGGIDSVKLRNQEGNKSANHIEE